MHLCLLPPEILLQIFSIGEFYQPICSRATLASLARTCRTLKEPALDILWKNIVGFKPLIACLPECVTNTDIRARLTLERPPLDGECRLLGRYTQRIRSLTVFYEHIDDQIMQAFISVPSPTPLLPNLRNLCWWDDRECFFPLLCTLFGSTITSVRLDFTTRAPSFAKSALVASIGDRCLSIQELHCEYGGDSQESSDAICEALRGLRELFRLGIGVFNAQTMLRLASLSSLKFLSLNLRTYNFHHTHSHSTPTSSSQFEEVYITSPSCFVLTHCLRNIRFLSCRSVNLSIDYDDFIQPYDPMEIPDLIISVSECFPPTLEKLHFNFATDLDNHTEDILADTRFALGFDVVAPMLSFSHLKYLDLDWICTSVIDDTSLKTMAQSWPLLEHFVFGSAPRWLVPPSLTFIGLVHLIHHCPLLRNIKMPFSACPVDVNSAPFSNTNPSEKIRGLFVGTSPIVDPVAVASQIHKLMPKLITVGFYDWDIARFPAPSLFAQFEADWSRVNDFLKVLTTSEIGNGNSPTTAHVGGMDIWTLG
ncbi:hypothetical protein F4604DRAFT_162400 [Suillus subluteus]|nr:hypothetical protein F4604DRAFT_162400 [Suillus subluteus]